MADQPHYHDEMEYLFIPNEDGTEDKFEILFTFEHDTTGRKYMLVVPADADEDTEADEQDVYAFRYTEDGDDLQLEMIEDDEEWAMVEEMFHTMMPQED